MNDILKKPVEKLEKLVNYPHSLEDIRNIDKFITNSMCSLSSGYGNHPAINEYIRQHKPKRIMEIGIANGDNAKKMIENAGGKVEYYGFDLFPGNFMDRIRERLEETGATVRLYKGYSNETIPANMDKLPQMDLIFIDGDHSYSGTREDWENSRKLMKENGVIFVHNYYSHKGVKSVVDEIREEENYSVEIFDDFGWGLAKIERIKTKL
ncbi:MAG: class I SAM-dependent methyltransferase [Archaeoglobaceae archaeon]